MHFHCRSMLTITESQILHGRILVLVEVLGVVGVEVPAVAVGLSDAAAEQPDEEVAALPRLREPVRVEAGQQVNLRRVQQPRDPGVATVVLHCTGHR